MDSKDYLKQTIETLIKGDVDAAKQAFKAHLELKSKDMLKEVKKED